MLFSRVDRKFDDFNGMLQLPAATFDRADYTTRFFCNIISFFDFNLVARKKYRYYYFNQIIISRKIVYPREQHPVFRSLHLHRAVRCINVRAIFSLERHVHNCLLRIANCDTSTNCGIRITRECFLIHSYNFFLPFSSPLSSGLHCWYSWLVENLIVSISHCFASHVCRNGNAHKAVSQTGRL